MRAEPFLAPRATTVCIQPSSYHPDCLLDCSDTSWIFCCTARTARSFCRLEGENVSSLPSRGFIGYPFWRLLVSGQMLSHRTNRLPHQGEFFSGEDTPTTSSILPHNTPLTNNPPHAPLNLNLPTHSLDQHHTSHIHPPPPSPANKT